MNILEKHNKETIELFSHTSKLVPETQRELFLSEVERIIQSQNRDFFLKIAELQIEQINNFINQTPSGFTKNLIKIIYDKQLSMWNTLASRLKSDDIKGL